MNHRILKEKLTPAQSMLVDKAVRRMRDVTGCYEMGEHDLLYVTGCIHDIEAIIYVKPKKIKKATYSIPKRRKK